MFKNAVIAILISIIHAMWIAEFSLLAFISLAAVLFFAVWAVEETVNDFKRKLFQRRIKKEINKIKITQQPPTKAS